jgi:hypothetical protein
MFSATDKISEAYFVSMIFHIRSKQITWQCIKIGCNHFAFHAQYHHQRVRSLAGYQLKIFSERDVNEVLKCSFKQCKALKFAS